MKTTTCASKGGRKNVALHDVKISNRFFSHEDVALAFALPSRAP